MALERDLLNNKSSLVSEKSVFADAEGFEFMNIVGEYSSLSVRQKGREYEAGNKDQ